MEVIYYQKKECLIKIEIKMKKLFNYLKELVSPRYKLVDTIVLETGLVCKHYQDRYKIGINGKPVIVVRTE